MLKLLCSEAIAEGSGQKQECEGFDLALRKITWDKWSQSTARAWLPVVLRRQPGGWMWMSHIPSWKQGDGGMPWFLFFCIKQQKLNPNWLSALRKGIHSSK
jgi:hypothetical protein